MAEATAKSGKSGPEVIATGRRKTAVARVRLQNGSGAIMVNGRDLEAYFPSIKDRMLVAEIGRAHV